MALFRIISKLVLVMNNLSNLFRIETIIPHCSIPHNFLYISSPISPDIKITAFFALIQNLFLSSNIQKLKVALDESEKHLEVCQGYQDLTRACNSFIDTLNSLIGALENDEDPTQSTVLKTSLYQNREKFYGYLEWTLEDKERGWLLAMLAEKFGRDFQIYKVAAGELQQVYKVNGASSSEIGLRKILLLMDHKSNHHILYEHNPSQLDQLLKISHSCVSAINAIAIKHDQLSLRLQEQLYRNDMFSRRIGELEVAAKQLEGERMRLTEVISGMENDTQRRLAAKELEKGNLVRELQGVRQEGRREMERWEKQKRMYEDNEKRDRDLIMQLRLQIDNLREENVRIKESSRSEVINQNSYRSENPQLGNNDTGFGRKPNVYSDGYTQRHYATSAMEVEKVQVGNFPKPKPPTTKRDGLQKLFNFPKKEESQIECEGELRQCIICFEMKVPYQLFTCTHNTCEGCLKQYFSVNMKQSNNLRCPSDNCKGEPQYSQIANFMMDIKQSGLLKEFTQKQIRNDKCGEDERIVMCPTCKEFFSILKTASRFQHCLQDICASCQQIHPRTLACNRARILSIIPSLDRPCFCPHCLKLFDKDQKCEHVTCDTCKPKQTNGFCPICCVSRDSIIGHDNSYHRTDCRFYAASPELPKFLPAKCEECKRLGVACPRPADSFEQFLIKGLGEEFNKIIKEVRAKKVVVKAQ